MSLKSTMPICLILVLITALSAGPVYAATCDQHLETIGAVSGGFIYMTYAFIGTTGDAFEKDAYPSQQVQQMMREVTALLGMTEKYLNGFADLNAQDRQAVNSLLDILSDLAVQANALADYTNSKSRADADRFQNARNTVWPKIKKILGIQ